MITLIDRSIKVCGSVKELARRLGMPANGISMLSGGRPMSPEVAAEMAVITGDDPTDTAIEAMIYRAEGTKRGEVLKSIFKK